MALVSPEGRYVKINKETIRSVISSPRFHVYEDEKSRHSEPSMFRIAPEMNASTEVSQELLDQVVAGLYSAMKGLPEFNDYTDK